MSIQKVINLVVILTHCSCASVPKSDVGLNTVEMIENHGYPYENHEIVTEDGYILTYQRIPHGLTTRNISDERPAVLLMHGLFASSAFYLDMGPKDGLAYILADLGYDVWLANARGTEWCRRHKTLDLVTDSEKFFDFSWHEIGYYDLPVAIDHILNTTKLANMYYIGHSQGGTVFLVLMSTRPEYASKIKLASLVSPGSFMQHQDDQILNFMAEHVYEFETLTKMLKIYEFPLVRELHSVQTSVCARPEFLFLCQMYFHFAGGNVFTPEIQERAVVILSHFPTYASTKQVFHFGQSLRNGGFRQYDHGVMKNRRIYGRDVPPSYNLSKISTPVAVVSSEGDRVCNYKDVKMLIARLPNVVYEYFGSNWGHDEILFLRDVVDPVHGKLIIALENY